MPPRLYVFRALVGHLFFLLRGFWGFWTWRACCCFFFLSILLFLFSAWLSGETLVCCAGGVPPPDFQSGPPERTPLDFPFLDFFYRLQYCVGARRTPFVPELSGSLPSTADLFAPEFLVFIAAS